MSNSEEDTKYDTNDCYPRSLKDAVSAAATQDGTSVNQFIDDLMRYPTRNWKHYCKHDRKIIRRSYDLYHGRCRS